MDLKAIWIICGALGYDHSFFSQVFSLFLISAGLFIFFD